MGDEIALSLPAGAALAAAFQQWMKSTHPGVHAGSYNATVCYDPKACSPAQVRKTPSWPRSWANFSLLQLCSHSLGMHRPTCIVWANLTPFSAQFYYSNLYSAAYGLSVLAPATKAITAALKNAGVGVGLSRIVALHHLLILFTYLSYQND
jgi:hypothetical protein